MAGSALINHLTGFVRDRPIAPVALSVFMGVWAALTAPPAPGPWIGRALGAVALLVLAACVLFWRRLPRRTPGLLLLVCVLATGCAYVWTSVQAGRAQFHPCRASAHVGQTISCRGVVAGDVEPWARDERVLLFPVEVDACLVAGEWTPGGGRLFVRVRTVHRYGRRPAYGEQWELRGRLRTFRPFDGPAIRHILETSEDDAVFRSGGHGSPLVAAALNARAKAAEMLRVGIESQPVTRGLLAAVILGSRSALPDESRDLFEWTGTVHVFAISGLHVGLIAGVFALVLTKLRVPLAHRSWVLIPLLWAYVAATGMRPSALRACTMATVFLAAPVVKRRADVACSIAVAAIAILVWSPRQALEIGFLLSFTVVMGIVMLYREFEALLAPLARRSELVGHALESRRIAWLRKGVRYLLSLVALSVAAWLSSAPLTATFFGRLTPVALVANVVVIPLVFGIVLAGILGLLLGSCLSVMSVVFNRLACGLVWILLGLLRGLGLLPFASLSVSRPPLWGVFLWYAALVGLKLWLMGRREMANSSAREK